MNDLPKIRADKEGSIKTNVSSDKLNAKCVDQVLKKARTDRKYFTVIGVGGNFFK